MTASQKLTRIISLCPAYHQVEATSDKMLVLVTCVSLEVVGRNSVLDLGLLSRYQFLHILVLLLDNIKAFLKLFILLSGLVFCCVYLGLEVAHCIICSSKGDCCCECRV
jgi:hypothetical protein